VGRKQAMTVGRIPRESFINETKPFYEVEARPFYSGTGRALVMVVYSELRCGLKDVGRAGDI
jgi:hypothetical protein